MMSGATEPRPAFGWREFRALPLRGTGIVTLLLLRLLYGLFYFGAALNKFQRDYLFSDYPLKVFREQLALLEPGSLGATYLQVFAIPCYRFVGWFITWGELAVAIGLLFGLATRWAGALALWITINIAMAGMADASLIPLGLIAALFIVFPTGHWRGFDRGLHARYPRSLLFR